MNRLVEKECLVQLVKNRMNIKEKIEDLIKNTLKSLNIEAKDIRPDEHPFGRVSLEHPVDLEMGDFSTNIAMVLAKENKTNPKELAEKIVKKLNKNLPTEVLKIQIAGAGFINFYLPKEFFVNSTREILENKNFGRNNIFEGKKVMVEYTQPNPFKPFHIGHLMSNTIGESISRIVEFSGAKMVRANYQGDIGPHVAKAIYELLKSGLPEEDKSVSEKARYIGNLYAKGNDVYETDEKAKKEIEEINKKIYDKSDKKINEIYDWGRRITLEAFEEIYKILGTSFNYYFFESIVAPIGEKIVSSSDVFEKSDGAIVFRAEKYNPKLHTRVFITSQGLPTYETKELGLTKMKFEKENLDLSVVITAHEQEEYMKVVNKALEIISPEFASKMKHVVHGMMRLASGKMSSRKGNVITGESLILESCDEILKKIENRDFTEEEKKQISKDVGVSALKYSILKQNIGGDIIYDFEKSISFEGDSGPYLQYSFARANSVLEKAKKENILPGFMSDDFAPTEVEKLLYRFPEIVFRSAQEFEPHYIANYLIDIARAYNTYYGSTKIIDKNDPTSPYKVALTLAFSLVIKNGLYLLGIKAPERM
ncbi:MAG: Arginine-tRNA ligase [Candidatus Nomurabacteria bacterium GW2011_GWF2_35_12]|uniref:Arginine--tRNA ligase n=2 Tax=Candidatus Nomuraibacteriota TaxID=1752729 RepID=A0A0G0H313_9BACT|nr:MAG: Arginine-tRNA ligase [Candidatus Nomurabacteria bacterium GW2011_GWF2_35_12]KKP72897.1 MAG: Arginine-tRNA ligase [Candidatus Nomurabacteria bacterium GW2011_GWB1_35_20]KKP74670.1 MAG: Arginine-tRNA ligase [Parcubacteria group bacterium GW2011_GWC1_35_21]KKP98302.1 MAG: Arginine-tRNA ligase [Candidatus Nomurabacteria bacterium GW2011_GWA1_36_15]